MTKLSADERALLEEAEREPSLACQVYRGLMVVGPEHERDLLAQRLTARGLLACIEPVGYRTLPCGGSASRYSLTRAGREALKADGVRGFVLPALLGRDPASTSSS
jgi:hypothetical protein